MSAIKGPLEKVGKYVDALVKELVCELPSFVQETQDVLRQLEMVVVSPGAIPVGIDVESLYTSIPHEWGFPPTWCPKLIHCGHPRVHA